MRKGIFFLLFLTVFASCIESSIQEPEEAIDYTEQNRQDILDYIEANNLVAQESDTGLFYVIENLGDGETPTATSNVTVAYRGYFLNGSTFDQSDTEGASFNLNQVILGWAEGITYFQEGGNGILLIPAHLGYGSFVRGDIPAGSVLIFDVNLISVN